MPVFRSGEGLAPKWCEMEYFDIVKLSSGDVHTFARVADKEKLIVVRGKCRVNSDGQTVEAEAGANLDLLSPGAKFEVLDVTEDATLVRMCGRWGTEVGGSGIFMAVKSDDPKDFGDAVEYPKETCFDNHYHDCDEYWIFFEGRGIAYSEGKSFEVGAGDCVVTGMGHHHDVSQVFEPMVAVFFETTMEGAKRPGHLWIHTHGQPEPKMERI